MYITSYDSLQRALEERARTTTAAREGVKRFLSAEYGFEEPVTIIPPYVSREHPVAVLPRQIASACAEDIAFTIGAKRLGLTPLTATFVRDAFDSRNHDKYHRVRIPWVEYSRNGVRSVSHEQVSRERIPDLASVPLEQIRCLGGKNLPAHHRDLRAATRLSGPLTDVSGIHTAMLNGAGRKPRYVYRSTGHGRAEERVELREGRGLTGHDRPPASWYYPYYLSWFVDGSAVLFETYDNPIAEVSEARTLFESCFRKVTEGTGFAPLIVKIPPLSNDMLWCNRHLLWDNDGIPSLEQEAEKLCIRDTVAFFRAIADSAIGYH